MLNHSSFFFSHTIAFFILKISFEYLIAHVCFLLTLNVVYVVMVSVSIICCSFHTPSSIPKFFDTQNKTEPKKPLLYCLSRNIEHPFISFLHRRDIKNLYFYKKNRKPPPNIQSSSAVTVSLPLRFSYPPATRTYLLLSINKISTQHCSRVIFQFSRFFLVFQLNREKGGKLLWFSIHHTLHVIPALSLFSLQ